MSESTAAGYVGDSAIVDLPPWKNILSGVSAILLGIIFFTSGCWKLADPFQWAQAMTEFQVPSALALPFTVCLGAAETVGALLIVVPRFRRWGSVILSLLLVAFIAYMGIKYSVLVGKDCSCFPLVKRTIGPGFFAGDGAMLVMALFAGAWSRRSESLRAAAVILGAVAVFAGLSFGINATRASGLKAPDSISVDGKPYALDRGRVFLFFYDPECMHCDAAARRMATLNWTNTRIVAIPTRVPQFAASFLSDTKLQAGTSNDLQLLRQTFKFVDPPYGVALVNGREKAAVANFDDSEPAKTLRPIGFVQ